MDWEALCDIQVMETHRNNNPLNEASTSWIGRLGLPDNLNQVNVNPAPVPHNLDRFSEQLLTWLHSHPETPLVSVLWFHALGLCRDIWPELF